MITLFQFPAAFNVPNASPYCLKLETWLRLAGLEYQVKVVSDSAQGAHGQAALRAYRGRGDRRQRDRHPYPRRALRGHSTLAWTPEARAGHGRSRACATNTCTT